MIGLHFLIAILLGRRRQVLAGLIIGGSLVLGTAKAAPHAASVLRDDKAAQRLHAWQALIAQSMRLSDDEKLQVVNVFFNRHIRYGDDLELWGQVDYWASPLETLELGAGDCEDFALAKYFTLLLLGMPEQRLRLVYTTLNPTQQAHMVLGYWSENGEVAVLLDNLSLEILPLAQRPDLQMQFAFGADRLYRFEHSRLIRVGDAALLPSWQVLKTKVDLESLRFPAALQLAVAGSLRAKREI